MTTLIPTIESTTDGLVVTSETIAVGSGAQHASVLRLLDDNKADFEQFGHLRFEIRDAYNNHKARIALLNEQQATLLMTFQRNTQQVKAFKVALVKAFYDMACQIQQPRELSRLELIDMARESELGRIEADKARELAESKAKELEAPATAWGVMVSASGDYAVDEAAKILSRDPGIEIGRNRLFTLMKEIGWIYRQGKRNSWHAYQDQVDNGRIRLRMSAAFLNAKTGEMENPAPTIRITAKGLEALHRHLTIERAA